MPEEEKQHVPNTTLKHTGGSSAIALRRPPGDTLKPPPGSAAAIAADPLHRGTAIFEWLPEDKEAAGLELRIAWLGSDAGLSFIPIVRWHIEFGHGAQRYREPVLPQPIISGTHINDAILPARGIATRIDARELRVVLSSWGTLGDPTQIVNNALQISVQPVFCTCERARPIKDALSLPPTFNHEAFPPEATEWRVRDLVGLPFAPATNAIIVNGLLGLSGFLPPFFAISVADWSPIPVAGYEWTSGLPCQAEYR